MKFAAVLPVSFRGPLLAWFCLLPFLLAPAPLQARERKEPVFASSAADRILIARIARLGPGVDPEEARRVVQEAYTTGRDLKREWRVVWPPGLQNYLVHVGARKGGLCFQWAGRLLLRLDALHLQTLELHWAESFINTASEHNVIVVTARGQPFAQGILLDNWRYGGRLVWGPVTADPHYEWKENRAEVAKRLPRKPTPKPVQNRHNNDAADRLSGNAAASPAKRRRTIVSATAGADDSR